MYDGNRIHAPLTEREFIDATYKFIISNKNFFAYYFMFAPL